jgi:cell division protein FtsN
VRALQIATGSPAVVPPPPRAAAAAEPALAASRVAAQPERRSLHLAGDPAGMDGARAAGRDGYGVQLGAFGSEASADREWQRLQGRFGTQLGGLSRRIVPAGTTSGPLYRLQASAVGEAQARAICDSLKEQSQPCVPVLPR